MMTEKYVKLTDVKKKVNYILKRNGSSPQTQRSIKDALNNLPYTVKAELETTLEAADVQPVVYCKECKHGKEIHYFEGDEALPIRYSCKFSNYLMSGDGYCSMGAVMEGKDR